MNHTKKIAIIILISAFALLVCSIVELHTKAEDTAQYTLEPLNKIIDSARTNTLIELRDSGYFEKHYTKNLNKICDFGFSETKFIRKVIIASSFIIFAIILLVKQKHSSK